MFKSAIVFLKALAFWLAFFALGRLVFLTYNFQEVFSASDSFFEVFMSFIKGFKLDLATASYFLAFPYLVYLVHLLVNRAFLKRIIFYYQALLIALYSLLVSSELGIYDEWRTKVNYKALLYLQNPSEVMNTAQTGQIIGFSLLTIVLAIIGIYCYKRFFYSEFPASRPFKFISIVWILVIPVLILIGARGGLQEIPINQSQSYYSKTPILNTAATNSIFNLYISYFENKKSLKENPFKEMSDEKALAIVDRIYQTQGDSCTKILNTEKPNIVLIIMESWSADLIFIPEGKETVTPRFHELMSEGVYFDQIYSTGARSEQGMASIFSGFPAHPISSITVQPDKYQRLPSMVKDFAKKGYGTSFYFGGQLIYGNIKSYMLFNEFDRIKEVYDFDPSLPQGKLGIHDEFTLNEMLHDLNQEKEPFFSSIFTLSTHSPYDQPMDEKISWGDNEQQYLNSAYYTDFALGQFMDNARKTSWYENTLFIFVADHSHNSYKNLPMKNPEYQKIPLLFYGPVIDSAWRGKTISHLGIQTNIAATLLCQLNMDAQAYPWSFNLLNPNSPEFAFVSYEIGFAWKRPSGFISFDKEYNQYHFPNGAPNEIRDSLATEGKAYLQILFQQYMDQ